MSLAGAYARLFGLLLRRRRSFSLALLAMVGAAAATSLFALLTGPALKLLFTGGTAPSWLPGSIGAWARRLSPRDVRLALPLLLFFVAAARAGFTYVQGRQMASLCLSVVGDLHEQLHEKRLGLPLSYFEGLHTGTLFGRFSNDLSDVERALTQGMTFALRDVIQLVALVALSLALDVRLFALGCVTLPVGAFAVARFARALRGVSVAYQREQASLVAQAQDLVSGATVLQVHGAVGTMLRRVANREDQSLALGRRSAALRGAVTPVVEVLAFVGFALILGAFARHPADLPPEKLISFLGAVVLTYQPLKSLSVSSQWIVPGLTAAAHLFDFLDAPLAIADSPAAQPLDTPDGGFALEGVSVRYGERVALDAVDLRVRAGEQVAIVGRSGAGKTTLLQLLPRLVDPSSGTVRFGGRDLRHVTLRSLRAHIAWVGQEVFLFDATVAENLTLGRPLPRAEVEAALETAGALHFATRLPRGLDTPLGERGQSLSGGQRQRLALARALLKRAPLLILDEPFSALEPALEAEILRGLARSRAQTLVLVTHRLQTATQLDRIVVLDAGRVVEDGPPASLYSEGWFRHGLPSAQETPWTQAQPSP